MKIRLKELRKSRDWTQDFLAEKLGVSKSHVSEMETGKKNPSAPMLDKIAKTFSLKVPELFEASGADTDAAIVAALMQGMTAEERQLVVRLAMTVKSE